MMFWNLFQLIREEVYSVLRLHMTRVCLMTHPLFHFSFFLVVTECSWDSTQNIYFLNLNFMYNYILNKQLLKWFKTEKVPKSIQSKSPSPQANCFLLPGGNQCYQILVVLSVIFNTYVSKYICKLTIILYKEPMLHTIVYYLFCFISVDLGENYLSICNSYLRVGRGWFSVLFCF